jgi:ribosomal protein L11 methyltransferase
VSAVVAFRVTVPAADEDRATGLLWDCETRGIEVRDAPRAGVVELIAYFDSRTGLPEQLAAALRSVPRARIEPAPVPEVDWVAHVRASFRPLRVGSFSILPVWHEPAPAPGPRTLIVDPGRAFGTGTHETTRLCLLALQALTERTGLGRVLDLGTGSGILAIAALRLGASHAIALDDDPEALASAAQHSRLNGVRPSLVRADGGRGLRPAAFDTIVANVSAPLLTARRDEIQALLKSGGALILSGFLQDDLSALRDAYMAGGTVRDSVDGEWAALTIGTTGAREGGS